MSDETPGDERDETTSDDREEFVPWHERQPWVRHFIDAADAVEIAALIVLVSVFGVSGLVFWLCGGTPPW